MRTSIKDDGQDLPSKSDIVLELLCDKAAGGSSLGLCQDHGSVPL
jgi:hypothetical protein